MTACEVCGLDHPHHDETAHRLVPEIERLRARLAEVDGCEMSTELFDGPAGKTTSGTVVAELKYVSPEYAAALGAESIRLRAELERAKSELAAVKDKARRFTGWRVRFEFRGVRVGNTHCDWYPYSVDCQTLRDARVQKEARAGRLHRNVRIVRAYAKPRTGGAR